MSRANEPAFPSTYNTGAAGLTKREEFAKAAMQGLLSNSNKDFYRVDMAHEAVSCADALLAELDSRA